MSRLTVGPRPITLEEAMEQALRDHPKFTIPDPLAVCSTEGCEHAAFYSGGDTPGFWCGSCGPRKSAFCTGVHADDPRQIAADLALANATPAAEQIRAEIARLESEDD
jgi:hypothetical protein